MQPAFVSAAKIAATLTPALRATDGVITITGTGDHLRPEWPITNTGMRRRGRDSNRLSLRRITEFRNLHARRRCSVPDENHTRPAAAIERTMTSMLKINK